MNQTIEQQLDSLLNEKINLDIKISKLIKIKESCCELCCDTISYEYEFKCCKYIICSKCIFEHIKTTIEDLQFKAIKCPFCNIVMEYNRIYQICRKNKAIEYSDKYKLGFKQLIKYKKASDIQKLDSILNKNKIYGECIDCTLLVGIKKECANAEGDIVILRKEMFICDSCTPERFKSRTYEELPYKKCPHCGILGKPNPGQCNYLYCSDHRWCYICQARLPLDNLGHNHHYWTGKGSSAYDFNCRVLANSNQNKYVLETCDCSDCTEREGKGLCTNETCSNLTTKFKCEECL